MAVDVYKRQVDISAALQAAIDAAAAAGGGVVYVPKGAYRLEQPIVVKSGVELQGSTAVSYTHLAANMKERDDKLPTIFNTASVAYLWSDAQACIEGAQGYYVKVYEDKVLVLGRDFGKEQWLASAQYLVCLLYTSRCV